MMPDLENALLGAQADQERTVEIRYPDDHPTAELAGKQVRYQVRVRKIQAQKLRDLDDNLAREVFRLGTLEELRRRIRENLLAEEETRVRRLLEAQVTDELIRRNPFDLPERLTQETLERVVREAIGDRPVSEALHRELDERYRPGVERALRREVLLAAIARQEGLAVGDEDVAREIDRMAQAEPRQAARIRARYQAAERREGLRESLLERRALEWILNAADTRDETPREAPLVVPAAR
jgi:trigger factor